MKKLSSLLVIFVILVISFAVRCNRELDQIEREHEARMEAYESQRRIDVDKMISQEEINKYANQVMIQMINEQNEKAEQNRALAEQLKKYNATMGY